MPKNRPNQNTQRPEQNFLQNKAVRQLFEGAKPTLERLSVASNRLIAELNELAAGENWLPVQDATTMRRRLSVLADRILALMEEPEEDALLSKTRLDSITSLLKAIDRLKAAINDLSDEVSPSHDETTVTVAFEAIDQRIDELAKSYAKELVESQSEQ